MGKMADRAREIPPTNSPRPVSLVDRGGETSPRPGRGPPEEHGLGKEPCQTKSMPAPECRFGGEVTRGREVPDLQWFARKEVSWKVVENAAARAPFEAGNKNSQLKCL